MMRILILAMITACFTAGAQVVAPGKARVKIVNGILQGTTAASGIQIFKGIPYAQAPVGKLRWVAPQPPKSWAGVRMADKFGPRAMQRQMYSDMVFRSEGVSEDCLYLNVWTPAKTANSKLPVLVYFYGGGFVAGDGSEYRYDGESMAQKGIVVVTLNYRLGIFGFMAHPELIKESAHHSSGNYGLMDQHAALLWVQKNIAAFGGDPSHITIGGESAGSASVSLQMASPLSKSIFVGAIGESGAVLGNRKPVSLAVAGQNGVKFAQKIGFVSLADLRRLSADSLLKWSAGNNFPVTIDGYFLPETPQAIYAAGRQTDIPLLAGWNSAEVNYHSLLGKEDPTLENYKQAVQKAYANRADEVLRLYPATADADVKAIATDLASDQFTAYATWKWLDLHGKTNGKPVYRYLFAKQRPAPVNPQPGDNEAPLGAVHASEIDYALGNLAYNKFYNWTADDYKVSETMQTYFANFIKTGDPNGAGLSKWYGLQSSIPKVMIFDANPRSEPEKNLKRYVLLDAIYNQ